MGTYTLQEVVESSGSYHMVRENILTALLEAHDSGYELVQWGFLRSLCGNMSVALFSHSLDILITAGIVDGFVVVSDETETKVRRAYRIRGTGSVNVGSTIDEICVLS